MRLTAVQGILHLDRQALETTVDFLMFLRTIGPDAT
ncbi:hypothetical protein SAMN05443635_11219 [Roseobacter denitrificans OCh 114]|nr:hypothetical protein SAMN05443635_11219 [Roseobacter denitrificans OCh 114]